MRVNYFAKSPYIAIFQHVISKTQIEDSVKRICDFVKSPGRNPLNFSLSKAFPAQLAPENG
ncbi:MAG TPA: hypothetical protein DCR93_22995 [Cytophagales bacterium]|nr:hypothetical protein [Cytophagales bacterium]